MNVPQFGEPEPGRDYPDRPAAFVVVEQGGKIAVARVTYPGGGRLDLPGGGLDPGETARDAARRECGEEVGLKVEPDTQPFTSADHYFIDPKGDSVNTRGRFFAAALISEAPELKIEDDHALVWMTPHEALLALSRESHVWAVAAWLRFAQARANG